MGLVSVWWLKGELCLMLMVIVEFQQLAAVSDLLANLEICETVTFQDLVSDPSVCATYVLHVVQVK